MFYVTEIRKGGIALNSLILEFLEKVSLEGE